MPMLSIRMPCSQTFSSPANFAFQAIEIPAVEAITFCRLVGEAVNFTQRQRALFVAIAGEHSRPLEAPKSTATQ
jgi:hypothetical protein